MSSIRSIASIASIATMSLVCGLPVVSRAFCVTYLVALSPRGVDGRDPVTAPNPSIHPNPDGTLHWEIRNDVEAAVVAENVLEDNQGHRRIGVDTMAPGKVLKGVFKGLSAGRSYSFHDNLSFLRDGIPGHTYVDFCFAKSAKSLP